MCGVISTLMFLGHYVPTTADSEDIWINQQKKKKKKKKWQNSNTLDKPHTLKTPLKKKYMPESEQCGAVLEKKKKTKEILQDKQLPISLKKNPKKQQQQVMDQCILPTMTYGCQTWSLNKQTTNKLRTAQRAMERKMLNLKLKDKIPCPKIRKRTKIIDIIECTLKQKWKWTGHIARLRDNRWTKQCTKWQPRRGKRSRGRPSRRWQDDITEKEGTTWIRKATGRRQWKTLMES